MSFQMTAPLILHDTDDITESQFSLGAPHPNPRKLILQTFSLSQSQYHLFPYTLIISSCLTLTFQHSQFLNKNSKSRHKRQANNKMSEQQANNSTNASQAADDKKEGAEHINLKVVGNVSGKI